MSISVALDVVRIEGVGNGEVVAMITELVSRELFPLPVVDDRPPGLEELTVGKDIEELTVEKDTSVVGSWGKVELTKELLEKVIELVETTSLVELVIAFTVLVVEVMSLAIGLAGCVYKEMLLHPTGTPVPILSALLSHT